MAPKVERVQRNEDYQFRQPGCSCCSGKIPSINCSQPIYSDKKRWYDSKYAGPVFFALAVLGAAFLSDCQGNHARSEKSGIESKTSSQ
ncbi:MAG TPA: hypothetical protein VHA12_02350 [Candidatus Nanoarchaeia archaeon]|nr:hypothetical protein [Candidatus Nanoarchaeia archaeon]